MKLIAIQDLKQPRRLKERLRAEKELLLTSDGRPVAVLVNVDASEDPETMIQSIRDSRSRLALSRVREVAARCGAARLSLAEYTEVLARPVFRLPVAEVEVVLATIGVSMLTATTCPVPP